jgi:lipoprotein NlpD
MFGVMRSKLRVKVGLYAAAASASLFFSVGCTSVALNPVIVEDRGTSRPPVVAPNTSPEIPPTVKTLPGAENAGKSGYYTVKPKDTLIAIGLENGQSPKDIARWNNLENINKIEIGQVLRVVPPVFEGTASTKPVSSSAVVATPVAPGSPSKPASAAMPVTTASSGPAPASASSTASAAVPATDDDLAWVWPTAGAQISSFEEGKTKGIDIGGASGDPVVAAADGRVIWAAAGEGTMRHYGNLIIVQHNKTYLTAYANNSVLLVKEDQRIKKGQKIAEIGNTGTDRNKLHFELRRMGIAVDPAKYLPPR